MVVIWRDGGTQVTGPAARAPNTATVNASVFETFTVLQESSEAAPVKPTTPEVTMTTEYRGGKIRKLLGNNRRHSVIDHTINQRRRPTTKCAVGFTPNRREPSRARPTSNERKLNGTVSADALRV